LIKKIYFPTILEAEKSKIMELVSDESLLLWSHMAEGRMARDLKVVDPPPISFYLFLLRQGFPV
jgi:hypothetical protein